MEDLTNSLTEKWNEYVKTGDHLLFFSIWTSIEMHVYFQAYKHLAPCGLGKEAAKDITQEVAELFLKKRKDLGHVQKFEAWVSIVIKHKSIDYIRAHIRSKKVITVIEETPTNESISSREMDIYLDARLIIEQIEQLKKKNFTQILNLHVAGYSNEEISEMLGKNEKYVRDVKHKARKELKKRLRKLGIL